MSLSLRTVVDGSPPAAIGWAVLATMSVIAPDVPLPPSTLARRRERDVDVLDRGVQGTRSPRAYGAAVAPGPGTAVHKTDMHRNGTPDDLATDDDDHDAAAPHTDGVLVGLNPAWSTFDAEVHQATGMILVELDCTADEAFTALVAQAAAEQKHISSVAHRLVALRVQ